MRQAVAAWPVVSRTASPPSRKSARRGSAGIAAARARRTNSGNDRRAIAGEGEIRRKRSWCVVRDSLQKSPSAPPSAILRPDARAHERRPKAKTMKIAVATRPLPGRYFRPKPRIAHGYVPERGVAGESVLVVIAIRGRPEDPRRDCLVAILTRPQRIGARLRVGRSRGNLRNASTSAFLKFEPFIGHP